MERIEKWVKNIEYIYSGNIDTLRDEVQKKIDSGWQPYGNLIKGKFGDAYSFQMILIQPIVFYQKYITVTKPSEDLILYEKERKAERERETS